MENRDQGVGFFDFDGAVGDVLCDEVLVWQGVFGFVDYFCDVFLPLQSYPAEVRFVAYFVIEVIELVQFGDDFSHHGLLDGDQIFMLHC